MFCQLHQIVVHCTAWGNINSFNIEINQNNIQKSSNLCTYLWRAVTCGVRRHPFLDLVRLLHHLQRILRILNLAMVMASVVGEGWLG